MLERLFKIIPKQFEGHIKILPEGEEDAARAGFFEVWGVLDNPGEVLAVDVFHKDGFIGRKKGVFPGAEGSAGGAIQFSVAVFNLPKGVIVKAEPIMQAMFFDAVEGMGVCVASGSAFSAESPAELVDGDVVLVVFGVIGVGELECGGEGGLAAA